MRLKKSVLYLSLIKNHHPPITQVVDSVSSIEWAAKNGINCIMWIPTVKTLKKRFEIYKNAKSEVEKKDVSMGDGITLVRDMFVAETMEDAKKVSWRTNGKLYEVGLSLERFRKSYGS